MKILITGASGMVGKNLSNHKEMQSYHLLTPSSRELDLLDGQSVKKYLEKNVPDLIIHCAGRVGGIQANIKHPVDFLIQNLDMGKNLVLSARDLKIKKIINLGSSCMYPRDAINPLKEDTILKGELEPTNEGYAIAKVSVAKLCEYINREDETFVYKTLIPCNLYGYHDKFDPKHSHMIPAVIRKIHEAKESDSNEIDIWGDGEARREFMFAEELSDFIAYAIPRLEEMPSYLNVGLGYDFSINEYYQAIAKVVGYKGKFVHDLSKPVGMKQKLVDVSKLNNFGWKSKLSLEDGINKTYNYFLEKYCGTK